MKFLALLLVLNAEAGSWPKNWANIWAVKANDTVTVAAMEEENVRMAWVDVNKLIGQMTGIPNAMVTPEYVMYRSGYVALGATPWFMTSDEMRAEMRRRANLTPEERKKEDDEQERRDAIMKADPWLNLWQPKDVTEANCMAISLVNGKPVGCGDVFQQGLAETELACFDRKTYVRCHLQCVEKIHKKNLGFRVGRCQKD